VNSKDNVLEGTSRMAYSYEIKEVETLGGIAPVLHYIII